ncbi:hypothetical protein SPI_07690 [Niveomyces insectorum RCEF 264]|uniref:Serine/threonine protein phosphatase n=1 Tax=Niveomyces insectorum RCEF 264 TaxID=1081102 RepID=A0A167PI84_9HYPO|nr:hypothetical protein SPI_07690 [Niveomyces insectorum RCEF 264]
MYTKDYRSYTPRKVIIRMDPDCAICHAPVSLKCDCEAQSLEVAILQAEGRVMQQIYEDIRVWVRTHARDYILEYFSLLTERRNQAHIQNMERIRQRAAFHYHAQPHPAEIAAAQATLKRGIDEDWQSSVQRYPEVLEHYFGLVELVLPADDDPMAHAAATASRHGLRTPTGRDAAAARADATPATGTVGAWTAWTEWSVWSAWNAWTGARPCHETADVRRTGPRRRHHRPRHLSS